MGAALPAQGCSERGLQHRRALLGTPGCPRPRELSTALIPGGVAVLPSYSPSVGQSSQRVPARGWTRARCSILVGLSRRRTPHFGCRAHALRIFCFPASGTAASLGSEPGMLWSILQGLNVGDSSATGRGCDAHPGAQPESPQHPRPRLPPSAGSRPAQLRAAGRAGAGAEPADTAVRMCLSLPGQRELLPSSTDSGQTKDFCDASDMLLNERRGLALLSAAPSSSR